MAKVATGKGFELELLRSYIAMLEDAENTITRLVAEHLKARRIARALPNHHFIIDAYS